MQCAKDNRTDIDGGLFDFFEQVLTLEVSGRLESEFVLRFQQFTSPVMAKGVEDTAFYCYNRLTAMCEVGGDPGRDGVSGCRLPCVPGEDAGDASQHDDDAFDPRHQAARTMCARG